MFHRASRKIHITGGNSGIGFEIAKRLAHHRARVVIASRNAKKSIAGVERIVLATGNPNVEFKSLDLFKLSNVKRFAEDFNKYYDRLDILINNAGLIEFKQVFTEDGYENMMQVNHIGPSYLTHLLLDKVVSSKPSRIIFVGSNATLYHRLDPNGLIGRTPRFNIIRYGNSKLCNVLVSRALARRLPVGVTVNALHLDC